MPDGIDTSLYPQPTNPISNLEKAVGVGQGVMANQLTQQQLQANTGLQQLYANAPRDANGNIDPNALMQGAPQAGIRAPEVIQAAQGMQLTQQQIMQQRLATQRAKMSMMAAAVAPLAKPGASPSDFVNSSNDLIQNSGGLITKQDLLPMFKALSDHMANGGDTSSYAQRAMGQLLIGGGNVDEGQKMLYGSPVSVSTGGGTQTGTQNPTSGAVTSSTYIPNTLPATATQVDNDPKSPTFGQTSYVGAATPSGPQPVGGTEKSASGPASVVQALAPGSEAMVENAGVAAQSRVDDTIKKAQDARTSQDVNQQVINLAGNLKDNVGPSKTGWTSLIGKIADTPVLGAGMKAVMDKDPTDSAGQLQELQKFLLRSAQLRGAQLGLSGTDYQTSLAQHANPNDSQFGPTIKKLAQYNLALDMVDQGRANALNQYPGAKTSPPAQQKFENDFSNALNLNVYRALIANPDERKELYGSMTPAQIKQMIVDRRKLTSLGAIPPQLLNSYQPASQ